MKIQNLTIPDQETDDIEILVTGLGGMGVMNLTRQIGALLGTRYPQVFTKESRGLAMRRASVAGSVRAGYHVHSPELYFGSAHYVLSLEPLEALRFAHYIRLGTRCLLADIQLWPSGRGGGDYSYPSTYAIDERITHHGGEVVWLPVRHWLWKEGLSDRYASSALFGAAAAALGFDEKTVAETLSRNWTGRNRALNYEALVWGFRYLHHHTTEPLLAAA